MASIYSVRMGVGNQAGGGSTLIFTAPAGKVSIIRDMSGVVYNGAGYGSIVINGVATPMIQYANATDFTEFHWEGRIVLNPGDTVEWSSSGVGGQWVVSGYELT